MDRKLFMPLIISAAVFQTGCSTSNNVWDRGDAQPAYANDSQVPSPEQGRYRMGDTSDRNSYYGHSNTERAKMMESQSSSYHRWQRIAQNRSPIDEVREQANEEKHGSLYRRFYGDDVEADSSSISHRRSPMEEVNEQSGKRPYDRRPPVDGRGSFLK